MRAILTFALSMALAPLAAAQEADVLDARRTEAASAQVGKSVRLAESSAGGGACALGSAEKTLHANNVAAALYNNGGLFWKGAGPGYEVPAYSGRHSIFASAIWIGGLVGGELRLAGTQYGPYEFWPGPLDDVGNPPAECAPYDRIYSVSVWDLDRYEAGLPATSDIEEWPWQLGAPVEDGDGVPDNYNLAGGDRPEMLGHQTAWWVMNDAGGVHKRWKTPPINMEVQVTAYAVSSEDALDNTTFYRYRLVYRGSEPLTDAWFGIYSDPDVGYGGDDFVGSDTTLGMAFAYNGDDFDEGSGGYWARPPAIGHIFLRTPAGSEGEPLGMTTFLHYSSDNSVTGSPQDGSDAYHYLRSLWRDGSPLTFGERGHGGRIPYRFMWPGDPVTRSFWSEMNLDGAGSRNTPADRYFITSSGPFSMNPGDEQDAVFAILWSQGEDHLDSVARLRHDAGVVIDAFENESIANFPAPDQPPEPGIERAPEIELDADELKFSLEQGETASQALRIMNTGTAHLDWQATESGMSIDRFLVTANAGGPLDPPDSGTFSFNNTGFPTPDGRVPHCTDDQSIDYSTCNDRPTHQQQVGPARWGINVGGGDGTFVSYLERAITGRGNAARVFGLDFEWRFTGSSLALRALEGGEAVEVPFELWNAGPGTPDDPSDNYRMIPLICEAACGAGSEAMVFDIGGDHPVSGAQNDPTSDWIYWYDPADTSPGDTGYLDWATDLSPEKLGEEVLARQVLVSFNGGTAPPYEQALPEPGTIFRIETRKYFVRPVTPGGVLAPGEHVDLEVEAWVGPLNAGVYRDTLAITSRDPDRPHILLPVVLEVKERTTGVESAALPATYSLEQNYPNPFNPSTTIRFGLPAAGPVRLVLYDVLGRPVRLLVDEMRAAGWHTITFDAGSLPAGVYFYRLDAGAHREVRSMLLVK